jgi:cell division protease FtsH
MSIAKSRAKVYVETDTKVTFNDVAGVEAAKFERQEVVAFLRDRGTGGRAHAFPRESFWSGLLGLASGVPFFSISGSEFVEMFVGVGAARVRALFEQAQSSALHHLH